METNKTLGYSLLGIGGAIGAYFLYKNFANPPTSVTWSFSKAGSWAKHLPDSFKGEVVLDSIISTIPAGNTPGFPYAIQSVAWFDVSVDAWRFWAPDAPASTYPLLSLVSGENYIVSVAAPIEPWPVEWTIPLV